MLNNASLRYGLELDRAYFIDFAMQFQFYIPILTLPTLHPIIQYLLIYENKSMRAEIRILYSLTHALGRAAGTALIVSLQLALLLNEWTFCIAYRIYSIKPIGALYCEGPLCRAGISKQVLMAIIAIPVILITAPFVTLMMRMHQMFVPIGSRWKLSLRTQLVLVFFLNALLIANVVCFGIFSEDHDDSARLFEEPEVQWVLSRGGTIFMFGPPGDPQHFIWALRFLGISILIISPFLIFFTVDSMKNISITSQTLSGNTQCMGAVVCYIIPLSEMLALMIIDATVVPGPLFAGIRITFLIMFTINGHQFVLFFIVKNPTYRKIVAQKFKQIVLCKFRSQTVELKSRTTPKSFSVSSRPDNTR